MSVDLDCTSIQWLDKGFTEALERHPKSIELLRPYKNYSLTYQGLNVASLLFHTSFREEMEELKIRQSIRLCQFCSASGSSFSTRTILINRPFPKYPDILFYLTDSFTQPIPNLHKLPNAGLIHDL